jgi:hypothetical protein
MKNQLNWNNKIIEIQIVISIVRVSEHFSKILVLSGVFNTRILDATNYANQDYMHVNYTLIVVYTMLLGTGSQSKNVSCFCLDFLPGKFTVGRGVRQGCPLSALLFVLAQEPLACAIRQDPRIKGIRIPNVKKEINSGSVGHSCIAMGSKILSCGMVHQGISRRHWGALRTTLVIEPSIFVEGDLA